MKTVYFQLLLAICLISCNKNNGNSGSNDSYPGNILSDNDWNIDVGECSEVYERFFYGGQENKYSSSVSYYNENDDLILYAYLNDDYEERSRDVYKYRNNELAEYKKYFKKSDIQQWERWCHGIVEKEENNENIITITKENRYNGDYKITKTTIETKDGKPVSTETDDHNGYRFEKYNENGDVVQMIVEHEFSNGRHHYIYELEYDNDGKIVQRKTYENNILTESAIYQYDENNLLAFEIINSHENNTMQKNEFKHNNSGKIISEQRTENGKPILSWHYLYDNNNRLIRQDEISGSSNRYWTYTYRF